MEYSALGMADSSVPGTLTFLDDRRFLDAVKSNPNIVAVITTPELAAELPTVRTVESDDPRFQFYTLYNEAAKASREEWPSEIAGVIHPTAYVSETNVRIGEGTVVGPRAVILPDVTIGRNCVVQPGAVIGSEGFEVKSTTKGVLSVIHDGEVIIGDNVEIGANTCIDKGFRNRSTIIEDDVKFDNLVHVAHAVRIGARTLLTAGVTVAGSCRIGSDVWLGVGAIISSGITIGDRAFVTLGSVVTRNVKPGEKVTGNFAIRHDKFLSNFKKSLR